MKRRAAVLLLYLAPLALLAVLYLRVADSYSLFTRNGLRAGCGPAVLLLREAGADPNDLRTYATAFAVIWPAWFVLLLATPLHERPRVAHAAAGALWCLAGFLLTLAI